MPVPCTDTPCISPDARARLRHLGLGDDVPAAELYAGRIIASILRPARIHCYPDGRVYVKVARATGTWVPSRSERIAARAEGARLAEAFAAAERTEDGAA